LNSTREFSGAIAGFSQSPFVRIVAIAVRHGLEERSR
jgi:hypothetical protein